MWHYHFKSTGSVGTRKHSAHVQRDARRRCKPGSYQFILAHGPGYQLPLELAGNQSCSIYTDFSSDSSTFSQKHLHAFEHDKSGQLQPNKFKAKVYVRVSDPGWMDRGKLKSLAPEHAGNIFTSTFLKSLFSFNRWDPDRIWRKRGHMRKVWHFYHEAMWHSPLVCELYQHTGLFDIITIYIWFDRSSEKAKVPHVAFKQIHLIEEMLTGSGNVL